MRPYTSETTIASVLFFTFVKQEIKGSRIYI